MKKIAFFLLLGLFSLDTSAQQAFTRKDSLQGGLRFERTCYDVLRYDLNIKVNPEEQLISGFNEVTFKVVQPTKRIQLDLFENMSVDSIVIDKTRLKYKREFNAVFVDFPNTLSQNSENKLRFYYSGKPIAAKKAPWDGGLVWKKDNNGKDWIGVAVQGTGASLWYPCKDSQTDEPDNGATIKVAVPNGLMDVSNGRLTGSEDLKNGYTRWDWEVKNPINNYDITLNIGDYIQIHDNYKGLDLDYYVLRSNEAIARKHFEGVKPMMDCFQSKFGAYPFADDSYKLVETSYLGMEHQSAVSYGNKYLNGYLGTDRSNTGIGLLFDYIIIHESGHEWFGNSITSKDIADMWIHEAFTMYTEVVYVECLYGYDQAIVYLNGMQSHIKNDRPIIAEYGVNGEGSGDMYEKGALMLNTIRHIINNDSKWWAILLKYSETYRHQIIDTQTVISFFNKETGLNLTPVFDQYLRTINIPVFHYTLSKNRLTYNWDNVNNDFNMPVDLEISGKKVRIYPTKKPQTYKTGNVKPEDIKVSKDKFLINISNNPK
jgi:aminopeptidase N